MLTNRARRISRTFQNAMTRIAPILLWLLLAPLCASASPDGAEAAAAPARFAPSVPATPPRLLRQPAISAQAIVFNYAGDLWIVPRDGGDARRLTTAVGQETNPAFSPDGSTIAFTGSYDGNADVYVVPAEGGDPVRLTWHPGYEVTAGWTPDGKSVLFHSSGNSYQAMADQLYTVPATGGFPAALPVPIGHEASFSPSGSRLAYVPHVRWQAAWKRYRGGQTTPIWIADLSDSRVERVPRENSNDGNPMWVGETVYFLSDRNGPVSLFAYDTGTREVRQVLKNDGLDIKFASATSDAIAYEQFGSIHLLDLATGSSRPVPIRVSGDFNEARPHYVPATANILSLDLSPSGARALMQSWGEIFTIPTDKGDIRNLTRTPGVAERDPAWSPDGQRIACLSDASGEYALEIRDQSGLGEVKRIDLGTPPSYYYTPVWSPDGKRIAYSDKRLNLWMVDAAKGKPVKVDTDLFDPASFEKSWSPDGKWIAYVKQLPSRLHAVFVYSTEEAKPFQVTDGMSDALHPCWDPNGKFLYFTASTDAGPTASWLDMSSDARPITSSVYVAVLSRDDPSPLAPQSDEEKPDGSGADASEGDGGGGKEGKDSKDEDGKGDVRTDGEDAKLPDVKIDIEGIGQRILTLPIPARNYVEMKPGKSGVLFLTEMSIVGGYGEEGSPAGPPRTIHKFDLEKREVEPFLSDVTAFAVSANGAKVLYRTGPDQWATTGTETAPSGAGGEPVPGEGPLALDGMQVRVEPRPMWEQIWREVWRIERDFFYDPGWHGLDLAKVEAKYRPYLAGIASRDELTYLFEEALGEMTVGHMFVFGGESAQPRSVPGGLLGADYAVENGRYRFARVYDGENWNPGLQAPLTQPGVNVRAGEYLLSVNGRPLTAADNVYSFFENTAGKQVVIEVGPNPDTKGSRSVTVVPVAEEGNLRRLAWIEGNRRKVDEMTGGRVAYIYLPDTGGGGYRSFNRYFFSQVAKEGAIIDERFNGGGQLADYIIDYLQRPMMSRVASREGQDWNSPGGAIYGPKVMIVNELAGSGGDAMPWYFRMAGIGPLVGKQTWGGLVGIGDYPQLMDGGVVTAPRWGLYGLKGEWEVENVGIAPDYDVDLDPALVRLGQDPQLEKAVELVKEALAKNPAPVYRRPEYPNYHERDGLGRGK